MLTNDEIRSFITALPFLSVVDTTPYMATKIFLDQWRTDQDLPVIAVSVVSDENILLQESSDVDVRTGLVGIDVVAETDYAHDISGLEICRSFVDILVAYLLAHPPDWLLTVGGYRDLSSIEDGLFRLHFDIKTITTH